MDLNHRCLPHGYVGYNHTPSSARHTDPQISGQDRIRTCILDSSRTRLHPVSKLSTSPATLAPCLSATCPFTFSFTLLSVHIMLTVHKNFRSRSTYGTSIIALLIDGPVRTAKITNMFWFSSHDYLTKKALPGHDPAGLSFR